MTVRSLTALWPTHVALAVPPSSHGDVFPAPGSFYLMRWSSRRLIALAASPGSHGGAPDSLALLAGVGMPPDETIPAGGGDDRFAECSLGDISGALKSAQDLVSGGSDLVQADGGQVDVIYVPNSLHKVPVAFLGLPGVYTSTDASDWAM